MTSPQPTEGWNLLRSHPNGNILWADAEKHKAEALNERFVFKDLGKGGKLPKGYSQIRVHMETYPVDGSSMDTPNTKLGGPESMTI